MSNIRIFIRLLILCIGLQAVSYAGEIIIQTRRIDSVGLRDNWITGVHLEHATSPQQKIWGLMGRTHLKKNTAMAFSFEKSKQLSFWMFNCYIDLSVAYIDENMVIREIHDLKAYPEKMDHKRLVRNIAELRKYPRDDPIVKFFLDKSMVSSFSATYALETNMSWFKTNSVQNGDLAIWDPSNTQGIIFHTVNLDEIVLSTEDPVMIEFPGIYPHSFWMPETTQEKDLVFLSEDLDMIKSMTILPGKGMPFHEKPVYFSESPIQYALIAPKGWAKDNLILRGTTVDNTIYLTLENKEAVADNPQDSIPSLENR
jgi:uncharacterized membrane protein (UPF0127 family)